MTEIKQTDVKKVFYSSNVKQQAHHYFDMLWKFNYCTRDEAYIYLADWLGVPEHQAHMTTMNGQQCKQVIVFAIQKLNDFRRLNLDLTNKAPHPYYELMTVSKKQLKKEQRIKRLSKYYTPQAVEMLDLIFAGKICPYCKCRTEYIDSSFIYGKSYGMVYICIPCKAYVGVHKGTNKALGRLANAPLREWKKEAHKYFDQIWKSNLKNRNQAYAWLSEKLNIPADYTHIGMFGVETCKKVVSLCKKELE